MSVRRDKIQLEVEINGQKAGQTYGDLTKRATALKRELRNLTPGTEAFINKSKELKTVNDQLADIRNQTRGVAQAQKEATTASGGLISKLKALGPALAAAFSVQAIGQFLSGLVNLSLRLDAAERKFNTVFGSATSIVTNFAKINAQSLGVTINQYEELATSIGDILIPMGFQREQAAKLSTDLVNLSGALSAWTNNQFSSSEVTDILTKALTGEREGLKQLGIVINETDVQNQLLTKGQKDLTGAALEQAKAQATLDLIYRKSTDAQTQFAESQEAPQRGLARLRAGAREWADTIANSFLPALDKVIRGFADFLSPIKRVSDTIRESQAVFEIQIETLKRGNLSQQNRLELINEINASFGEYSSNLLDESSTLEDIAKFQNDVNKALEERIIIQAATEELQDVTRNRLQAIREEKELQLELSRLQQERLSDDDIVSARTGVNLTSERLDREIEATERAIKRNKELQAELQSDFEETSQAALSLGIDLTKAFGGGEADGDGPIKPLIKDVESLKEVTEALRESIVLPDLIELGLPEELLAEITESQLNIADKSAEIQELITDNERRNAEERIAIARSEAEAKDEVKRQSLAAANASIEGLIQLFSKDEEARKKNFSKIKQLESAKILINLAAEISNIFKGFSTIPLVGQILGAVQAAAATARAVGAISRINSADPGFYYGGYTGGQGIYSDSQGDVAGVVHTNEWVSPEWMVRDPATGPVIKRLERIRRSKGGFVDGGFAGLPSTDPIGVADVSFSPQGATGDSGSGLEAGFASLNAQFDRLVAELRKPRKNYVVYEDIEDASDEINTIRQRSAL